VFCADPALVCCVANKVRGVRAAAVATASQAARARKSLAANLLAVEMPGRTLHELRQIVRTAVARAACPAEVAKVLEELDGHAHR
jgi:ribose 5-phosphate isomerase RpiB